MNKQELIEYCESLKGDLNKFINGVDVNKIIKKIEQLDEPQKPIVPQVVMDYYEFYRGKLKAFEEWFAKFEVEYDGDFQQMDEVGKWLYDVDFETQTQRELALAMLIVNGSDAVEVEKKRYLVKIKGVGDMSFLNHDLQSDSWLINNGNNGKLFKTHHTRKDLEEAGFGWVFNCEGIEIEEVVE